MCLHGEREKECVCGVWGGGGGGEEGGEYPAYQREKECVCWGRSGEEAGPLAYCSSVQELR